MDLNDNKNIRVVRGESPEQLTEILRSVTGAFQILGFDSDDKGPFAYYRTTPGMAEKVSREIKKFTMGISRGGEAARDSV